jgi:hypothetical protein
VKVKWLKVKALSLNHSTERQREREREREREDRGGEVVMTLRFTGHCLPC